MSALAILRAARETLSDPERWTQHAVARDARGWATIPESRKAKCWCALWALRRHGTAPETETSKSFLTTASAQMFGCDPITVNDHRDHAAVLAMYDRAIALAAAEASV